MPSVKVVIVGGAGGVGASAAFNPILLRGDHELVLVDRLESMVTSHTMDLDQVLELSPGCSVRGGDLSEAADAEILVVTAAVPLRANAPRLSYLAENARILDAVADALPAGWAGVAILVTNPVDPLVTRFRARSGLDRRRVIGYTINDSLRLRTGIAQALQARPGSVEAWALGEHGDGCVPLFDRVEVDGEHVTLTADEQSAAVDYFRSWYPRHVALDSGRSSTWTSGHGVARMVTAVAEGADEPWPASVVLEGEYGIAGVAVSVPVALAPGGVAHVHEWTLRAGRPGGAARVRRARPYGALQPRRAALATPEPRSFRLDPRRRSTRQRAACPSARASAALVTVAGLSRDETTVFAITWMLSPVERAARRRISNACSTATSSRSARMPFACSITSRDSSAI